ncbi:helix-turn-helix domain-containing protein [Thiococcus pfennigii]|uniref:helix-turn-helix domain-containing protein n=1 Tax=Thiococcus pfennigii TaxID=1057 RepID=UPI0019042BED|nr:XRE family transcriptional regulator [Thiococcus pfennigii]MBK1699436.1 DNA-binding protein [Thiococcus pfennigii]
MIRVTVKPDLLRWARERAGLPIEDLIGRFPKLAAWERGESSPTFNQLEAFAKATHVPFGFLFLPEPPDLPMPIPDFRTLGSRQSGAISPDLLDTIYAMQRRQAWLREERLEGDAEPLAVVGSARVSDEPEAVGREMRRLLGLGDGWAARVRTWQEAVSALRAAIEELGVIAVINGIVGNDTHRRLNVEEFRGFALTDDLAPLIFVNGADAKSAQMFTLAHELAHVWLGAEGAGLSGFPGIFPDGGRVESFCDRAAAEFLVPAAELRALWPRVKHDASPFEMLASAFKVSPIVMGRRAMDLGLTDRAAFFDFYDAYVQREKRQKPQGTGGGSFYNNQNLRVGRLFAVQVMRAAKEGRIGFKDAYDLTGLHGGTFQEFARRLGVDLP